MCDMCKMKESRDWFDYKIFCMRNGIAEGCFASLEKWRLCRG